ncbi:hypothetical protein HPB52_021545 [Rhipicephalus sanguineus]|uniref:Uncharacterized protein n=1 Tax=Rhipicephalus sanguineus TaxID=34632 RepID=A0A9D4PCJ5_RHISA|nr:hypothetical protein HPB52_021545 [Rhipicephalus sanguineus]
MEYRVEGEDITPEEVTQDQGWLPAGTRRLGARMRAADANLPPLATEAPRHRENETRLKNKIIRAGRMPFLPREDTKIVIRPRGGLNIVKVGVTLVADAILAAAGISEEESQQDTLCPNVQQNIMVASTPNQENVSRYINIRQIVVQGKEHEISAYVTAPHSTCKGVIRGIPLQDSPNTINAKIVNEKNPLALMAKRIAQTGTVIVAFDGHKVPNLVKYGSTLLRCTLYRQISLQKPFRRTLEEAPKKPFEGAFREPRSLCLTGSLHLQ